MVKPVASIENEYLRGAEEGLKERNVGLTSIQKFLGSTLIPAVCMYFQQRPWARCTTPTSVTYTLAFDKNAISNSYEWDCMLLSPSLNLLVLPPQYLGKWSSDRVKERVTEVLYGWTLWLKEEAKIQEAYRMLKKQGVNTHTKHKSSLTAVRYCILPTWLRPLFTKKSFFVIFKKICICLWFFKVLLKKTLHCQTELRCPHHQREPKSPSLTRRARQRYVCVCAFCVVQSLCT